MEKEIRPIILTNEETGDKYTLEFTAESVKYAEFKGFQLSDIEKKPMTTVPLLFAYSFRAHHPNLSPKVIDKLYKELDGLPSGMLQRLTELYIAPYTNMIRDEDEVKNSKVTVEL